MCASVYVDYSCVLMCICMGLTEVTNAYYIALGSTQPTLLLVWDIVQKSRCKEEVVISEFLR